MPGRKEFREGAETPGRADVVNTGIAGVKKRMSVIASCGKKVGVVDRIEGNAIKLAKSGSLDGLEHFIPIGWIERVDGHVHLRKNSKETQQGWKSDAASCQCEWVVPVISSGFYLSVEAAADAEAADASRAANGLASVFWRWPDNEVPEANSATRISSFRPEKRRACRSRGRSKPKVAGRA